MKENEAKMCDNIGLNRYNSLSEKDRFMLSLMLRGQFSLDEALNIIYEKLANMTINEFNNFKNKA